MVRGWAAAVCMLAALGAASRVRADCQLIRRAELPITMVGTSPEIPAKINGTDVRFIVDSGAFFSMLSRASAQQLDLHTYPAPFGFTVQGVGGDADVSIAKVRRFTLTNSDIPDVEFLVGGSQVGSQVIGLLGQNVLGLGDVEYDLANGSIKLFETKGCGRQALAYWAPGKPYSMLPIEALDTAHNHTVGSVRVNGVAIQATFDTGAARSVLSLGAARRAGVTPDSPGVVFAGYSGGIGRRVTRTWIAPVASFQVGDEIIKTTRLRIGELGDSDMLLGADFFLSHHVYVANSQRKVYFTYNGGPVFDLRRTSDRPPDGQTADASAAPPGALATAVAPASGSPPGAEPAPEGAPADPTDADGFSRRGAAFAARRDYARAIADDSKAIALAPADPDYLYQRAMVRIASRQPFMAMNDLDAELKLRPGDVQAHITRATLRLEGHDRDGARADVDAAAAAAARQADQRLRMAELYLDLEQFEPAVAQFDLWIAVHDDDNRLATALSGRCRGRALADQDLDKALSDCNAAVRLTRRDAIPLENRGLVHQRRGEFDLAIADFNAALEARPKTAWALYGRGVCEMKTGAQAQGDADLAAAAALAPHLAERAAKLGLTP